MFKQLKALRIERSKKEKELKSLYILTDYFDMQAMAEQCQYIVNDMEDYHNPKPNIEEESDVNEGAGENMAV